MTPDVKVLIVAAATAYMAEHKISANELGRQAGINVGYLSPMLRGIFTIEVKGKPMDIGDSWFTMLALQVGFETKKTYWKTVSTRQFVQHISTLETAKNTGRTAMIIGKTGMGKTNGTDVFCHANPLHTYRITVSSLYKLVDIVEELTDKLVLEFSTLTGAKAGTRSIKIRVDRIVGKLTEINRNGGKPIIIFDEGENMEMGVLKMLKGLYDALKDHCAIVIIGTHQLLNKLLNLNKRQRDAIPQLYRRFKAGTVQLYELNKEIDFKPFFDAFGIEKPLRLLLTKIAENYGELNDYLEPALREADRLGEPLTEKLFRTINNIAA